MWKDARFRAYLVENGWDGVMGEDDLTALAKDGQEPGQGVQIAREDLEKEIWVVEARLSARGGLFIVLETYIIVFGWILQCQICDNFPLT